MTDLRLLGSVSALVLAASLSGTNAQAQTTILNSGSVVISSSTYDNTQGAVASLTPGVTILSAGTPAVAGNSYPTVWNNNSFVNAKGKTVTPDGSFGVTSEITLTDINAATGATIATINVPTNQVVTSFSSKSELGLHLSQDAAGNNHLVFVGYGGAGVGALDVSNSDAVAGQDPTNPVTMVFGSTYAFPRTIVNMDAFGNFAYTPTTNYGGNNGRSALFDASTGFYYMVGNANNGNASTFGPNGTSPDVTETTGLEVVAPIDAPSYNAVPPTASAEVDPLLQFIIAGKTDKAGKDNNFRGITDYNGALYFTKGSGSNGYDTVYTANPLTGASNALPTFASAPNQTISIVPGFPNDPARTSGNFTPFAVFFANPNLMYVSDEGSGDATDASSNAGLQKWIRNQTTGVWSLAYVLTKNLIGTTHPALTSPDGVTTYPATATPITTVGLRNMTGVVNKYGTVTLWATTSTSSTSGDQGADPNQVVKITDFIAATTNTTGPAATEAFQTVAGPTYGVVYRGVAYVK